MAYWENINEQEEVGRLMKECKAHEKQRDELLERVKFLEGFLHIKEAEKHKQQAEDLLKGLQFIYNEWLKDTTLNSEKMAVVHELINKYTTNHE